MTFDEMIHRMHEDYAKNGATFTVLAVLPGWGIAAYTNGSDDPRSVIESFHAALCPAHDVRQIEGDAG